MLKTQISAVQLTPDGVVLLNQNLLPHSVQYQTVQTVSEMIAAIQTMIVRGAPAIGVAGAFGMVLSARANRTRYSENDVHAWLAGVLADAERLREARPTAVNLQWAIDRLKRFLEIRLKEGQWLLVPVLSDDLEQEAIAIYKEDLAMCKAIGDHGVSLIPTGARILTHCNAGALATAGYGTALGVIRSAFKKDPTISVIADETRPRLQGARLTTWEMLQEGIPVTLITDNMSAWLMQQGGVDVVIVGADRIAANGDTANKIGTYLLALAAKAHNIPFYVAAPSSTIDFSLPDGRTIPIETRPDAEISHIETAPIAPEGVSYWNPAFDVTPAQLITAIITEHGVFAPHQLTQAS